MWARHFELSLAIWLFLSPFIFAGSRQHWTSFGIPFVIMCISLFSYLKSLDGLHYLNVITAAYLIGQGYISTLVTPQVENQIMVGWILLIFTFVPNRAVSPPKSWKKIMRQKEWAQWKERRMTYSKA